MILSEERVLQGPSRLLLFGIDLLLLSRTYMLAVFLMDLLQLIEDFLRGLVNVSILLSSEGHLLRLVLLAGVIQRRASAVEDQYLLAVLAAHHLDEVLLTAEN